MAKTGDKWSAVGRRARSKGKRYEREIAALMRHWTGVDWQTTRNSGRTDLLGDVYLVGPDGREMRQHVFIECKHRASMRLVDLWRHPKAVSSQIEEAERQWRDNRQYHLFLMFVKTEVGTLVTCSDRYADFVLPHDEAAPTIKAHGRKWVHVDHFAAPVVRGVLAKVTDDFGNG